MTSPAPARRAVPWGTVGCLVAALGWFPGLVVVWKIVELDMAMGLLAFGPVLLGALGALLAAVDRRLDGASRLGWATTSLVVGLLALPLYWFIAMALWGA